MTYRIFLVHAAILCLFYACHQQEEAITGPDEKSESVPLFSLLTPAQTGVAFENTIVENPSMNYLTYEYFYNGGGVAIADFNNDGLQDLFFTGNLVDSRLYLNKGGLKFEDITERSGVAAIRGWKTGVTVVDINQDGYQDIYICYSGRSPAEQRRNVLLVNQKNLVFKNEAHHYGLDDPGYSTQASFFDYDRDGDLDMFLVNHSIQKFDNKNPARWKALKDDYTGDKLFKNERGRFFNVSDQAGLHQNPIGFGLSASVGDLNRDGWPDVYVTNDYLEHDYLYINNQDGTFTDQLKKSVNHLPFYAMGSDIADFNNDGYPDIVALDMVAKDNYRNKTNMSGMNPRAFFYAVEQGFHYQYMFNTVQLNNGNGTFSEIAKLLGVAYTDWSWAPLFVDLDNDGKKDLYVTNGYLKDARNKDFDHYKNEVFSQNPNPSQQKMDDIILHLLDTMPSTPVPNYFFKNEGGLTFSDQSKAWGGTRPSFSNGAAFADLDNDGDLELIVNNINQEAFIYKNQCRELLGRNYLRIKLNGPPGNRSGIGTHVKITHGNKCQYAEHYLSRGYQSSIEDYLHFGVDDIGMIDEIGVTWPGGKVQVMKDVAVNQQLEVFYHEAIDAVEAALPPVNTLFSDMTDELKINYRHVENAFDDFERESLLPHKMSQFGPALAVGDANGDELDDFYLGGATGQAGSLFIQRRDGSFEASVPRAFSADKLYEDVDAVFFDADSDGDQDLYVVSGGNERKRNADFYRDRLYKNEHGKFKRVPGALPALNISGSSVRPVDYDQDGDPDLFIGGRQVPGQYPYPADSYLLRNNSGKDNVIFEDITREVAPMLNNMGMVTDAAWTDLNSDGFPDLLICGEWMSVRLLMNQNGELKDCTDKAGLEEQVGWWNSITAADFDRDGDTDLVVGNLGLNYKYQASKEAPFEIYATDFDDDGSIDIVLGYYEKGDLYPLRGRECSSNQMPFIKEKFPTYGSFAQATLQQVYDLSKLERAIHYRAVNFSSSYFENHGDGTFSIFPLENHAQLSSINDMVVEDFDLDGNLDLLAMGNLYGAEVETPRNDASYGLYLKGDGLGNLEAIPAYKTGLMIAGEVRKLGVIHLADGHKAIIVAKNNDYVQLIKYH